MLFKANITREILEDEDKLCEQLYIFLKEYVAYRLQYENFSEREDCTQDTILFMLKRFKELTPEELDNINIEKFFYNRARSFISSYVDELVLRKQRVRLMLNRKVPSNFPGNRQYDSEFIDFVIDEASDPEKFDYINYVILKEIVSKFSLVEVKSELLIKISEMFLKGLGYKGYDTEVIDLDEKDPDGILKILGYAVVDEYLLKSITERRDNYK
jgi:hypothetical protein